MFYKLKELNFDTLEYSLFTTTNGKVINIKENLEFQTPRVILENIKDNIITLKILPTQASSIFYNKMQEFETVIKNKFQEYSINSLFNQDTFTIKIKTIPKVFLEGSQFNYYHLKPGMELIFLVDISRLWINNYNEINYTLSAKEILIKKV